MAEWPCSPFSAQKTGDSQHYIRHAGEPNVPRTSAFSVPQAASDWPSLRLFWLFTSRHSFSFSGLRSPAGSSVPAAAPRAALACEAPRTDFPTSRSTWTRDVQKCGFIVQIQLRAQHAIKLCWLQHSSTTQNKSDYPHSMCLICGLNINRSGWKGPSGGHLVYPPVSWDYQLSATCLVSFWKSPKQVIWPPLGNLSLNALPTCFTQNFSSCWSWLSGPCFHCGFIQYTNIIIRKPLNPKFSSAEL